MTSELPNKIADPEALKALFKGIDFDLKAGDSLTALKRVAMHFGRVDIVEQVECICRIKNIDGKLHLHLNQYIENYVKLKLKEHLEEKYSSVIAQSVFNMI